MKADTHHLPSPLFAHHYAFLLYLLALTGVVYARCSLKKRKGGGISKMTESGQKV